MSTPRQVFRPIALQRHEATAARTVRPEVVAPRTALWLSVLVALLTMGGAAAATARVPVVAEGWAVVDAGTGATSATSGDVVVLLPPGEAGRLRIGQPVTLKFPGTGRLERSVTAVVPGEIGAAEARRRWASASIAAIVGTSPMVAVLVPLTSTAHDWTSLAGAESIGRAEVEVGTRSIGSLLPVVGRLFGG